MRALLVRDTSIAVRPKPDLRGPVFGRHGDERDVDHQCEGDAGVVEVGVGVGWLGSWWGVWGGRKCGVAGDEAKGWVGAEGRGRDLGDDGVWVVSEAVRSCKGGLCTDVNRIFKIG